MTALARPQNQHDSSSTEPRLDIPAIFRWSLWGWGNASVGIMVTFIFGVYLAEEVGPGGEGTQYLTTAGAIAGALLAVTAPVIGQRADRAGRRRLWLVVNSVIVVGITAACFFVQPQQSYLLLGVILLSSMTLFNEIAELNYNAMLTDISDRAHMGRVSGIGWASGYLGGIVLLVLAYFGFIAGDWLGIGDANAVNVRMVAVVAAVWFLIWALPLLLRPQRSSDTHAVDDAPVSILESYRRLWRLIRSLWAYDSNTVWFLISSAIYRDGLSAVFAYGAILGATVYGVSGAQVLLFGIAGNVVAAAGAFLGGFLDDKIGPRAVILISVGSLVATATLLFFLNEERSIGPVTLTPALSFWIFGLFLCLFVGPAQASSRGFMARVAPPERASEMFGLYATAGRSVSFLTPAIIALIIGVSSVTGGPGELGDRTIIIGIGLVLTVGALAFLIVHNPEDDTPALGSESESGSAQEALRQ